MVVLPPGTLLQLMYLQERLEKMRPAIFMEIGPGRGDITDLLLKKGWTGFACDLERSTIQHLETRFELQVRSGQLKVVTSSYLDASAKQKVDLVISCMVMEHLEDEEQRAFMQTAAAQLLPEGKMIGIVPASPEHWGIEDDIAGHKRRYTRASLRDLAASTGWRMVHLCGLTFPVSNWLLPLSNFLVNRAERNKLRLTELERTKKSGIRHVHLKTDFPPFLLPLLNRVTMRPFHALQKLFCGSSNAMVLYFEALPPLQEADD